MVIYSTIASVKQVDPLLIKSARTMGATPQQFFRKVIVPAALPSIFVGIRLASASAMLVGCVRDGRRDGWSRLSSSTASTAS
ncbi:ABC transporter permease subunit [Bradyrhizobium algeriense]|uniref:ABC transporter permease subunit n=1 Tax=Bradyrhizobium algeriense TaxID=634784 RepID=UPI001FCED9DC|nr:ABC transporter permease subunit [Bradyrhizobium algeriense]